MNGYQCYLKRTLKIMPLEVKASQTLGYNLGIKLIRGAYMNEERMIAQRNGTESPVFDQIEGTHMCYNTNMELIISQMKPTDTLFVASHNVDSVEKAIGLATAHDRRDNVLFGQLQGFSDHVTNNLASRGLQVFKYVPFGPTEQVMPYLVRRGQESRQVVREQKYQNVFLKEEIKRRLRIL